MALQGLPCPSATSQVPRGLRVTIVHVSLLSLIWLHSSSFRETASNSWFLPLLGQLLTVSHRRRWLLNVFWGLWRLLEGFSSSKPQMRKNGVVFSFKRFPPRMSHFPRPSGCEERQVDGACGCCPPDPSVFSGLSPVPCTEVRWEYPWMRNFTWGCSPFPPLSAHRKDPKFL